MNLGREPSGDAISCETFVNTEDRGAFVLNRNQTLTPMVSTTNVATLSGENDILNALSCRKRPNHVHISAAVSVQLSL